MSAPQGVSQTESGTGLFPWPADQAHCCKVEFTQMFSCRGQHLLCAFPVPAFFIACINLSFCNWGTESCHTPGLIHVLCIRVLMGSGHWTSTLIKVLTLLWRESFLRVFGHTVGLWFTCHTAGAWFTLCCHGNESKVISNPAVVIGASALHTWSLTVPLILLKYLQRPALETVFQYNKNIVFWNYFKKSFSVDRKRSNYVIYCPYFFIILF